MRLRPISKLLQGQDVCLFCAFRQTVEGQPSRRQFSPQSRSYNSTAPTLRPASGLATAQRVDEEDEDDFPMLKKHAAVDSRDVLLERNQPRPPMRPPQSAYAARSGWICVCGHTNISTNTDSCTVCRSRKPQPSSSRRQFHQSGADQNTLAREPYLPPSLPEFGFRVGQTSRSRNTPSRAEENERLGNLPFPRRSPNPAGPEIRSVRVRTGSPATRPGNSFYSRKQDTPRLPGGATNTQHNETSRFGRFLDRRMAEPLSSNATFNSQPAVGAGETRRWPRITDANSISTPGESARGVGVFGIEELLKSSISKKSSPVAKKPSRTSFKTPHSNENTHNSRSDRSFPAPAKDIISPLLSSDYSVSWEANRSRRARDDRGERRNKHFDLENDGESKTIAQDGNKKGKDQPRSISRDLDFDEVDDLDDFMDGRSRRKKNKKASGQQAPVQTKPQVQLPEFISVEKLAQALKIKLQTFLSKLEEEGFEGARYDHILDADNAAMFADLYGFEPVFGSASTLEDLVARPPPEDKASLPPRPPIVTIMGHVDHGKTTILDWLRKSSVVETEHGGITQHIGAFQFSMPGSNRQITFLDTPGHAAFLDMRRRGAIVTDIVVLVVAADDSVKPQTLEAIKHALDAKVQIIVAINKVDKPDANIMRVKQDLAQHEIAVEEYGGEYQAIALSGKTGQGMADLEEAILALADVEDFRAEVDIPAEGWIIESQVTVAGRVATVLVRRGTLRPGDIIVAGTTWARVRTLRNDAGNLVEEALPGTPVQVDGWRGDPVAGLEVLGAEDEEHAKSVVELRVEKEESLKTSLDTIAINNARTEEAEARAQVLEFEAEQRRKFVATTGKRYFKQGKDNEGWVEGDNSTGPRKVHFVVKADVTGSVEALVAAVSAVGNNEIVANVVHSGAGLVTESDIWLLAATGETSYAISFNQPIDNSVSRMAEAAGLQILDHNIIYKVTDDVKEKLADALPPLVTQKVLGEAEVGQIFEISTKKGKLKIAGCRISNGIVDRSKPIRVLRKGEILYTGKFPVMQICTLESLKNVKKDVSEMRKGSECGMNFKDWSDFEVGDQIQSFEEMKEKRTLY